VYLFIFYGGTVIQRTKRIKVIKIFIRASYRANRLRTQDVAKVKILFKNLRNQEIKIMLESMDDLWHLFNIVERGDMVFAQTYRREEKKTDKLRPERGKKKPMRLGIEVEDVDFHEFSDRLRVHGIIKEGPQDIGSYHTLNLEEGDRISLIKEKWKAHYLTRLEEAVSATKQPLVIFLTLDYDEAYFAYLRQSGVQETAHITTEGSGKRYKRSPESKNNFYSEILHKLKGMVKGATPVVILGPGFAKEELFELGKDREPDIFSHAVVQGTGQVGLPGIHEALKEGLAPRILKDTRVGYETTLVEELLAEISKDGNYAYGHKEVEEAVSIGAAEKLLVTDRMVREKKVDKLLKKAQERRTEIAIINAQTDCGKKLESLGGAGAILRYRMH
jgi:protein pelota